MLVVTVQANAATFYFCQKTKSSSGEHQQTNRMVKMTLHKILFFKRPDRIVSVLPLQSPARNYLVLQHLIHSFVLSA